MSPADETPATEPNESDTASAETGHSEEPVVEEPVVEEPVVEEPVVATDPVLQGLVDGLKTELGEAFVGSEIARDDVWVRVKVGQWRKAAEFCRRDLAMDYFCFLSGIDWLADTDLAARGVWDTAGAPDDAATVAANEAVSDVPADSRAGEIKTGVAGGDTRFQVFARLYSTKSKLGITLKADLDGDAPTAPSLTDVYRGADWHEREAWEMYGFDFTGHPGLRNLYLPGGFEGNPLRKDFPMLAREVKPWPGLVDKEQIPGETEPEEAEATT